MSIRLVYIAGPFTAETRIGVELNIEAAVRLGIEVAKLGAMPIIPHSNTAHSAFEEVQPYQFWIDGTEELRSRCDALLTLYGWENSKGASREVRYALADMQPVFHELPDLAAWLRKDPVRA